MASLGMSGNGTAKCEMYGYSCKKCRSRTTFCSFQRRRDGMRPDLLRNMHLTVNELQPVVRLSLTVRILRKSASISR